MKCKKCNCFTAADKPCKKCGTINAKSPPAATGSHTAEAPKKPAARTPAPPASAAPSPKVASAAEPKPQTQDAKPQPPARRWYEPIICLALLALVGCSSFDAEQTAPDGTSTHVRIKTLFDGKSEVAKLKTTQTDKTQGVALGSLSQESSGTNAVDALRALDSILGKIR
jgi:type IV secretory pathway VirB10-like protein